MLRKVACREAKYFPGAIADLIGEYAEYTLDEKVKILFRRARRDVCRTIVEKKYQFRLNLNCENEKQVQRQEWGPGDFWRTTGSMSDDEFLVAVQKWRAQGSRSQKFLTDDQSECLSRKLNEIQ